MPATVLPLPDLAPDAADADLPAGAVEGEGEAFERAARHELALPLFDDDGVMIRVLLEDDEDLD